MPKRHTVPCLKGNYSLDIKAMILGRISLNDGHPEARAAPRGVLGWACTPLSSGRNSFLSKNDIKTNLLAINFTSFPPHFLKAGVAPVEVNKLKSISKIQLIKTGHSILKL